MRTCKPITSWLFIGILLISLLAGALVVYATSSGVWGYSDSVAYLVSARNLARGMGLGYAYPDGSFHLLSHYPPLFPLILSLFYFLHLDALFMLRILVIFLFTTSIFVAGLCIARFTTSPELAIPACLLMVVFPGSILIFTSGMSEPLFVCCWFCSAFMLLAYFHQPRPILFWCAAITTSLVPFTRYIGVSILAASCLAVLLLDCTCWRVRIKKTVTFGLVASSPTLFWLVWGALKAGHILADRKFNFDGSVPLLKFKSFLGLVMQTFMTRLPLRGFFAFFPYRERWILFGVGAIGVVILSLIATKSISYHKASMVNATNLNTWVLFSLFSVCYFMGMAFCYLYTLPVPDVNDRLLLPLYLALIIVVVSAFSLWQTTWLQGWKRWFKILAWLISGLLVIGYWPSTRDLATEKKIFTGILEDYWQYSETMQAINSLPLGTSLISNEPSTILLWADRPAYDLLETLRPEFLVQGDPYGADQLDIAQKAFHQGGALVLFKSISLELKNVYGDDKSLSALLEGLYLYGNYKDGAIYFANPP
jgi:hypothetical protein